MIAVVHIFTNLVVNMLCYYCSTAIDIESESSSNTAEGNVCKIRFLPTISPGGVYDEFSRSAVKPGIFTIVHLAAFDSST